MIDVREAYRREQESLCLRCSALLPDDAPFTASYCSGRCRQAAYRQRQRYAAEHPDAAPDVLERAGALPAA